MKEKVSILETKKADCFKSKSDILWQFPFRCAILVLLLASLGSVTEAASCPSSATIRVNKTKQFLTSPNYPNPYPRPLTCSWTLQATEGDVLLFRFWDFAISNSVGCYRDIFSIADGASGFAPEFISLCGSFSSSTIYRTRNPVAQIKLSVVGRGSDQPGFNISFWTEDFKTSYNSIHYSLAGVSGVLLLLFLVGVVILMVKHKEQTIRLLKCKVCSEEEEDEDDDEGDLVPVQSLA